MLLSVLLATALAAPNGYYRDPALSGDTLVFTAEGDLWRVQAEGGAASRLTTHPAEESSAVLSPDGTQVAFAATYEGPREIYTMPLSGGLPTRITWDGWWARPETWSEGGLAYRTYAHSTLPASQLVVVREDDRHERIPLAEAAHAAFDGDTLFFTRMPAQSSATKRYAGGWIESIWRFTPGDEEATPLTGDYPGTSKNPLLHGDRIVFVSDRDGSMNLWSMARDGTDLKQHTDHDHFDVSSPTIDGDRVVYQHGADLWLHDLSTDEGRVLDITLGSDLDQTRERWVDNPRRYLTSARLSPDGSSVALTARGRVFVAPSKRGRLVQVTDSSSVRYREATYLDNDTLVTLSDESGELELWSMPTSGMDTPTQHTDDGEIHRMDLTPSPDGKYVAYTDRDARLFVMEVATGASTLIDTATESGSFQRDMEWSPDSGWLAYVRYAGNDYSQIWLHPMNGGEAIELTSDRVHSSSPAWSPDGQWLYFVSDRNLENSVSSPWGAWAPEPHFDRTSLVYAVPLRKDGLSPWHSRHELQPEAAPLPDEDDKKAQRKAKREARRAGKPWPPPLVIIDEEGLQHRLIRVPVPAHNIGDLAVLDNALLWTQTDRPEGATSLYGIAISHEDPEAMQVMGHIDSFEVSAAGDRMMVAAHGEIFVFDAGLSAPSDLSDAQVDLSDWTFSVDPREEWRLMLTDAWRMERDYFYDRGMHGNDWDALLERYLPLVDRVTDRAELSDLIAQMVGELSALHINVFGGDEREGSDDLDVAKLGARLERTADGFEIAHIYRTDPEYPAQLGPLLQPHVGIEEGDVITAVDGRTVGESTHIYERLRAKAGQQVRLTVRSEDGERDTIVEPIGSREDYDLRYREWEYTRRLEVEEKGDGELGYLHLRAMGGGNYNTWAREYYPIHRKSGLIIDVRHNNGGNIDSWILEKLIREAWMYWQGRTGEPYWNMQYAFRGHLVVLTNARTASDGEAFAEGFRRLGLGPVIGTRTWGGEIWLSTSNWLQDGGIATAAMTGVYGPEGEWLIEGHGVVPDQEVDNLPHATFKGQDAQLEAAVAYLKAKIAEEPVVVPPPPPYPDKSRGAWKAPTTEAE